MERNGARQAATATTNADGASQLAPAAGDTRLR
jgi:hypothetical protein